MQPLADKLRPTIIEDLAGQEHLLGDNGILKRIFCQEQLPSMIFWGPAGSGKTTVAKMLLKKEGYFSETMSATSTGVQELRRIFEVAENKYKDFKKSTILFIDEIHCFKKNQQDVLLPYIEKGIIVLIGATTENPSFELNGSILSRCRILTFRILDNEAMEGIMERAEKFLNRKLPVTKEARRTLIGLSNGDARYLLNMCEELFQIDSKKKLTISELLTIVEKRHADYDKQHDNHYNLISAFHKSLRGSDVQASLYWLSRMLEAGEDIHFIFRRLSVMASEDIGMADPNALLQVTAARQSFDFVGSPEGELFLVHATVYCATAPKSNAQYLAKNAAISDVKVNNYQNPPKHILNAPTKLMKELGYSEGYIYDHDTINCFSGQNYFPDNLERREYYKPNERGFEREIKKRLEYWKNLRLEAERTRRG
ncbi:MAG: replication-associated recombination protein A [Rickettsiales bacterium]|jgi:putative ATPase|nr:replication-associated recombination protein A [Rickettsiales bacterium]